MTAAAPSAPDRRRLLLSPMAQVNGVDFVSAQHRDRLHVHFVNRIRVRGTLARDRAPITLSAGSGRQPTVHPIDEETAWSTDTSGRPVLRLAADLPDVSCRYVLTVHSDRLDPWFRSAAFTIRGGDDPDTDCGAAVAAVPEPAAPPVPIDYLAKDFASFCLALSNFSAARYPQWVERSEADIGVMLMEALSALADELSYLQDRVAAEATIDTATQRVSLQRHARLVDYEPGPAVAATTIIQLDVAAPLAEVVACQATDDTGETIDFTALVSPARLTELTAGTGYSGWDEQGPAHPRWNRYADQAGTTPQLVPYLWDSNEPCLRRGATGIWITGHGHDFYPGQKLLIDTVGAPGEAPVREIVQVADAHERTDPVQAKTEITIVQLANGLTYDHDLTKTQVAGNLVLGVQGMIVEETFAIPGDAAASGTESQPLQPTPLATNRSNSGTAQSYCLYTLTGPLAWLPVPARDGGPADARPLITLDEVGTETPASMAGNGPASAGGGTGENVLPWSWVRRLLDADGTAPVFTITPEGYSAVGSAVGQPFYDYDGDGTTVRFGDGTFGGQPAPGTVFRVRYVAGGGVSGNVGADAIVTVTPGSRASAQVWRCTNPMPASGGADAETVPQIRDRAPEQVRAGLLSLTAPADYAAAALAYSAAGPGGPAWARQAVAAVRWTGSWPSVLTAVDPTDAAPSATQLANLGALAKILDGRQLAGSDSSVALARLLWLDLRVTCDAAIGYRPTDVEAAILARLGPQPAADGATGFFGRDRWTFGQPLEASALTAAIQSCRGVAGITRIQYRKAQRQAPWRRLPDRLTVAQGEILRIDDNPSEPEHGLLLISVRESS